MAKISAGILLYRFANSQPEMFLVHPGGPFWAKKDLGTWSIPKGEIQEDEDALAAAKREFAEETGFHVDGAFLSLGEIRQTGGKIVKAWALERDLNPELVKSNTFEMVWPPRSGIASSFPEIDRAAWFPISVAEEKLLAGQRVFLRRLLDMLQEPRG